jgi:hypothetical protein
MRRLEIQVTLIEAIKDHFPDDVAEKFSEGDIVEAARKIQDDGKDDYGAIDRLVRELRDSTPGITWDQLADGDIPDPGRWFLDQIR